MLRARLRLLALAAACAGCQPPATLTEVDQQVFKLSCAFSSCHNASSRAGGLVLSENAYENLVNVTAKGASDKTLVVPGAPEASYLLEKMKQAKPAAGTQMPPANMADPSQIALVERWIAEGAKND